MVRGKNQVCSFCGEKIEVGDIGLSIMKKSGFQSFNVWIHLFCIKPFLKLVEEGYEKNKPILFAEKI